MMCPKCGKEMRKGYLFGSKDGAFSFADEVPDSFENAKNADGFVKLTELKVGGPAWRRAAARRAGWSLFHIEKGNGER